MGMFNLFRKTTGRRHNLTEEDREKAADINRERFELQRLRVQREKELLILEQQKRELQLKRDMAKLQSEIAEYDADYPDEDSDDDGISVDKMLTGLMAGALAKSPNASGFLPSPTNSQPLAIHLSDEDLLHIWADVPKQFKKIASTMSDDSIKSIILNKVGNVDEDTLTRALNIVKRT